MTRTWNVALLCLLLLTSACSGGENGSSVDTTPPQDSPQEPSTEELNAESAATSPAAEDTGPAVEPPSESNASDSSEDPPEPTQPPGVGPRPYSAELTAARATLSESQKARTNPFAGTDPSVGKDDYDLLCASCHGAGANGGGDASIALGGLANNLLATTDPSPLTEGESMELVRRGIPGTMMQGFAAARSDAQLWRILHYIDSLR